MAVWYADGSIVAIPHQHLVAVHASEGNRKTDTKQRIGEHIK